MRQKINMILSYVLLGYFILCVLVFFLQEKLIFHPKAFPPDYKFSISSTYEEKYFEVDEEVKLHALLFKSQLPKGLIIFLHGNGGTVESWAWIHDFYTQFGYDLLIPDYRGYGKSQGKIHSEEQLFQDFRVVYEQMAEEYEEKNIILIGFSLGTGIVSKIASEKNPKMLILKAPYYSVKHIVQSRYPFLPSFLLKYPLETHKYLPSVSCPIEIFHGTDDRTVPYSNSLKLEEELGDKIKLIAIPKCKHNDISVHPEYTREMEKILSNL